MLYAPRSRIKLLTWSHLGSIAAAGTFELPRWSAAGASWDYPLHLVCATAR